MKRKYPKDNDTIKDITKWLNENKVDYKWKSKRKAELIDITHVAVKAVKKRNKMYPKLTDNDLPTITISLNNKKKLVADIAIISSDNKDTTSNRAKKDETVKKHPPIQVDVKPVENKRKTKHTDTTSMSKAELLDKILDEADEQLKEKRELATKTNKSNNSSSDKAVNKSNKTDKPDKSSKPIKINSGQLQFSLNHNEWLIVASLPTDLPENPILDLTTGNVYSANQQPNFIFDGENDNSDIDNTKSQGTASSTSDITSTSKAKTNLTDVTSNEHSDDRITKSGKTNRQSESQSIVKLEKHDFELGANNIAVYYDATGKPVKKDSLNEIANELNHSDAVIAVDTQQHPNEQNKENAKLNKAKKKKHHYVLDTVIVLLVIAIIYVIVKMING